MVNNHNSGQLDSSIKEELRHISVPYSSEDWQEMERLLEKNPRRYGASLSDYSQYIAVGALGMLLIGGLLYMIFRNIDSDENVMETKSEITPLEDTSKSSSPNVLVQDSVKIQPAVSENTADSVEKNNLTPTTSTQEEQNKGEEKKKRTRKDSLTISSSPTQESTIDTSGTKKPKKKKKKKSSTSDSLLKSANPAEGINFLDNVGKPLPAEEPVKSSKDTSR